MEKREGGVMENSKMSDAEINKAVAFHVGLTTYRNAEEGIFDPCNNPADAWPLILKNRISLVWDCAEDASYAVDQLDECRVQRLPNLYAPQ